MKHFTEISKRNTTPVPASLDILGLRALIGLVDEFVRMLSGVSSFIKGMPLPDGGDGHDDDGGDHTH